MARAVAPYPWASLERLSRAAVRQGRAARRAVDRAFAPEALAGALGEVLSAEVSVIVRDVRVVPFTAGAEDIAFELSDGTAVMVRPEPALATLAVARLLGRVAPPSAPGTALGAPLRGATAAVVIEAARRSGAGEPLALASALPAPGAPAVRVDATVLLDGRPYAASAHVVVGRSDARAPASLASLGDLVVSLPVVVALSTAEPGALATLAPGDAWLAGDGWWIDTSSRGRGALAAPASERGIGVDLAESGAIVVGNRAVPLSADTGEAMSSTKEEGENALRDAVLDAPVVVRVELGAVSMTAREWGELRPGDVLETGRRVNEPVVLRVAGREVARGDLVEIEGELGVRVREVFGGAGA